MFWKSLLLMFCLHLWLASSRDASHRCRRNIRSKLFQNTASQPGGKKPMKNLWIPAIKAFDFHRKAIGVFGMSETLPKDSTAQDILPLTATDEGSKRRNWGILLTGVIGGTLAALYSVATPFIAPALRKHCLPFVPATSKQIENVLNILKGRNGSLVDIGSGDGRIVIAAAKVGFKAVGYELNPWLVWYSRYRAWKEGVHQDARFYISDLWKVSFSQYTNVVIFGVPQMMLPLEKKLGEELQLDARVIACRFPFPHWRPTHSFGEGIDTVWAYDSESFKMKKRK